MWDIINERQIQFITTRRQYYEEIFNVRKGLYTIKHSSLANVTDISQIELKLHNLHENSGNHHSKKIKLASKRHKIAGGASSFRRRVIPDWSIQIDNFI